MDIKTALLLHNPGAGDEDHSEKHLIAEIQGNGYNCQYFSVKEDGWKDNIGDTDLIIIAGGDGTVRKVVKALLKADSKFKKPVLALLPMGTANNIAKTLGISSDTSAVIRRWKYADIKAFDIGLISNLDDTDFFLEGMGYGVFPALMKEMKKQDKVDNADNELEQATKTLHKIIMDYDAIDCKIEADGQLYADRYLLAEIMNICSIGPNLNLAPDADPGNGTLEVVMVQENKRNELAAYIKQNGENKPGGSIFQTIRAESVKLECTSNLMHADDKLIDTGKPLVLEIKIRKGVLNFLV